MKTRTGSLLERNEVFWALSKMDASKLCCWKIAWPSDYQKWRRCAKFNDFQGKAYGCGKKSDNEDIIKIVEEAASSVGRGSMSGVCHRLLLKGHGLFDLIYVNLISYFYKYIVKKSNCI
tara:strand:- start:1118 stop:1474 length:357 start_codon:yes stop_codon:yes gene_type:complete